MEDTLDTQPRKNKPLALSTSALIELDRQVHGLGSFIHILEASNQVHAQIAAGEMDGLSSSQAFEKIWHTHSGPTVADQALAYAEGGGGYSVEEWIEALEQPGSDLPYQYGPVRMVGSLPPMLFELPEPPKQEVTKQLFSLADNLIHHPELIPPGLRHAGLLAARLQTHLAFLHPKLDGNGRSSEDWMLWWQHEITHKSAAAAPASAWSDWLGVDQSTPPLISPDTIRSWHHHGMRLDSGNAESVIINPDFIGDQYQDQFAADRSLVFQRKLEINQFKREMYRFLAGSLNYRGSPEKFGAFILSHPDEVSRIFSEMYSDANIGNLSLLGGEPVTTGIEKLLLETGPYSYTEIKPEQAVKPEFLTQTT